MNKVLVLGGTRFFGKRLVRGLLEYGADVTLVTRGNIDNPFGYQVKWRQADRNDSHALADALRGQSWDVVYDQICYTPAQAEAAVSLFEGRTSKYVLTSTLSVYQGDKIPFTEEDFDPVGDPQQLERSDTLDYGEAKRSTEAVLFQRSSFPVTAVRFPIVMGLDDYTKRLRFHIEHVLQEKTIGVPNPLAEMGYISSQEAADFLLWLGDSKFAGTINACSDGVISLADLLLFIEDATGKKAITAPDTPKEDQSPYGVKQSWYMDNAKATRNGYHFMKLMEWLPGLILDMTQEVKLRE
ncbi:NAD-dependent epimerase/dehydratase family protein [Paenibacillus larvae]|uniref:NAD-dependent epimerase/dehydratase family protein n=1 Tax=Paenibacillus larvae TaxID=1464 RepID=UPI00227D9F19|nr:NAD-dependent epimerase/dehydratase family protein [Paenibacillus larvae]MCY9511553.1 NAD-dependent epimerase/dehydratase family protein [Paenibacillus larvae]MCY9525440.1 NAD-dependent epimerase/dehydratase family protein [Paenibacillus larvae]